MIHLNYVNENRYYQRLLDRKFGGKIVPLDRFVNGKATIRHYCIVCNSTFWGKPGFLINLDNHNHLCINTEVQKNKGKFKRKQSKVTDEMKITILRLHNEKVSTYEIAKRLGVTRETVRYHLNRLKGNI